MLNPAMKSCLDTVNAAIEANKYREAHLDSIQAEANEVVATTEDDLNKNQREYRALADARAALDELDRVK